MENFNIVETRDHSVESQIALIMESFQFDEVHMIFVYMDYKYIAGIEEEYLPDVSDLKYLCENLLRDAAQKGKAKKTNMTISSGRFEAFWENVEECLSLKFVPYEKEILFNEEEETIFTV